MQIIYTYLLTLPILVVLDFIFLGVIMKESLKSMLSPAITLEFNLVYAALFYILYLVGIFVFVIYPNISSYQIQKVLLYGAMFGFFCYMTYDMTNAATVKNWPAQMVIIDIIWGTIFTSATAYIAYNIFFWLK